MRHVISVSLQEETILELRERLRNNPDFRNKSHFIESAILKAMQDLNEKR